MNVIVKSLYADRPRSANMKYAYFLSTAKKRDVDIIKKYRDYQSQIN